MPRFSANLSILFPEHDFLARFPAARAAGFEAVECWFPYDHPVAELRALLDGEGLTMVGINTAPGGAGEWGVAALPGREADFDGQFAQALDYAVGLGAGCVHVLAGHPAEGGHEAAGATFRANLARAARRAEGAGVTLLTEPLNPRDRPGYLIGRVDEAAAAVRDVGAPNLGLLFDAYHVAMGGDDVAAALARHYAIVRHVQVAAVPDRGEPDRGEWDAGAFLGDLDARGWGGWVGLEYRPRGDTLEGLRSLAPLGVPLVA